MSKMSYEKVNSVEAVLTVALYIRVSTEEQVKYGYSLEAQQARLFDYCKIKGYKVHDIYIDKGKTARTKLNSRKEMLRLVEDAKQKKFNRIIFWKLDRWFRNIADYYKVQSILDENLIDWECSDEDYNTTTSSGRLNLNIRLSIAQNESDQTGDRIRFNFENMVKQGRPIQGSHCMPLGYIVAGEKKNKKVVKDPDTKHIVDDMFQHFDTYKSVRATLLYINTKYSLKIHYDSMSNYFKNELYTGTYREVDGYCEAYISKLQFEKNLTAIKRNARDNTSKHDYIFSGLLRCSRCHRNLAGFTHRTTRPKYNKVYTNAAYRCNYAFNCHLCENKSPVFEKALEEYLIEHLEVILKEYVIEVENIEPINEQKEQCDKSTTMEKMFRLNELYIAGRITKEKYEKDYNAFLAHIEELNMRKTRKVDVEKYRTMINTDIMSLYAKLNNKAKRAFWSEFIDYIERDKDLNFIVHLY